MLVTACTIAPGSRAPDMGPGSAASPARTRAATSRRRRGPHLIRPRWAINVERLRERLRDVAGFTLLETLVTAVAAVVVLSATFALLESGQQVQARDSEWAVALQEDRAGLARMMRDIRQATEISEPTTGAASSHISFLAIIGSTKWKIKYDCSVSQTGTTFTECVRFAAEEGKSFPANGARTVIDVTDGNTVFSYSPTTRSEAKLVTAKIELPAKGTLRQAGSSGYSHKVVLEDGAFMRNVYFEG